MNGSLFLDEAAGIQNVGGAVTIAMVSEDGVVIYSTATTSSTSNISFCWPDLP